jgi:1-acyl-sn-glycerol-3-phosphate acyltransferase
MERLGATVVLAAFAFMTIIGMPVQSLLLVASRPLSRWFAWRYWWAVSKLLGLRIRVHGAPLAGTCLFVANHASWLDIVALGALRPLCFIAKREVSAWPLFGRIARLGRTVFVDRERRGNALQAREDMTGRLAEGDGLVLFAEGTSSDGNRVLGFRSTLFAAADFVVAGAPVPVQPVSIAYTQLAGIAMDRVNRPFIAWYGDMRLAPHLWYFLQLAPVDVDIAFHPATSLAEFGDRKALARACETSVRDGQARLITGRAAFRPAGSQ